ncbi:uncharacterized protein itprid1 isoform X1 [Oreochromis aureus]|uniref:uncharacterized protein itprid1 isoform X1 n=1 Tax=Oreochromis aureus TaxID=47969 RepID=UPI001952F1EA|nr:uncharacterized protein itprid1 isoform X1 [Oreochromis aureus]
MAFEGAAAKRAKLIASRVHWGNTGLCVSIIDQDTHGNPSQDSIGKWLSTNVTQEDAKQEPLQEDAGPLQRNPSSDDDLALGVEASLYAKQGVKTVQEFLRWSSSGPALSRWNSFSSATSGHSGPLSVMDVLNLWNDDPEEILLDLGFGCDEPDLSGRIPARFINYQSQARGINLQVFLEAQKNRLDLENPDVSNRFRQLEVLQQVTTAFSSFIGSSSSPMKATQGKDLPPEAQERRRRMGMLFRRASKKSLGQIHRNKTHGLTIPAANCVPASESQQPTPSPRDKNVCLKRVKAGSLETASLSPLAEEQGNDPDLQSQHPLVYLLSQEGAFKSAPLREGHPLAAKSFLQRKKSQGQIRESFEMEEIQSFDESSVAVSYVGGAENFVRGLMRTNSCQSDSSGFLEEPFIPLVPHLASPGSEIIKARSGFSERSADNQGSEKPESSAFSPHTDKSPIPASTMTSCGVNKYLPSSPCPSPDSTIESSSSIASASLPLSSCDLQIANTERAPNQDQSPPASIQSSSSGAISSQLPTSPHLPHSANSEICSPPTLVSPKLIKLISQTPESNKNKSFLPDSDGISFSKSTAGTQKEEDESLPLLSFHLDKANPSAPPVLDFSKLEEGFPTPSSLSYKLYIPVCQPDVSSQSHHQNDLIDPASGKISDQSEQVVSEQHSTVLPPKNRQHSHNDNNDLALSCQIQNGTNAKMNDILLEKFQRNEKQQEESEGHGPQVSQEAVVYISDTETPANLSEGSAPSPSEVESQSEMDTLVNSSIVHDDMSAKTKQNDIRKLYQKHVAGKESESPGSYICLHDQVAQAHSGDEVKPNNLIAIENLDLVFETSVDDSDNENIDLDDFFQQLDTEGRVYWAEPIQLSNPTPEASGSFEASDGSPGNLPVDSFSSTGNAIPLLLSYSANTDRGQTSRAANGSLDVPSSLTSTSQSAILNVRPSNRSVSVQMPSYLSSHIVHRKDVPYTPESKSTRLPIILPLDTSSPFRAVQSWTDLQIQRNTLTKNLSYGALHAVPNKTNLSMSCPGMTQKPAHQELFSSSPSFFHLSNNWKSQETIPEMAINCKTESVSVDTGLWPDEQEEDMNRNGNETQKKLWEGNQQDTMACCCSCDHTCCIHKSNNKEHTFGNSPYSLDELEEMLLCLQQFWSVLSNMEEQLSEDQAAVYSCLSDQDREKIRDIEELRRAVKQEAGELERQLKELAYEYDESLKMKMHRLLDEQSLLCSQLKVFLPGTVPTSSSNPMPNRTVATQCSLLPLLTAADIQSSHISDWKGWKTLKPGLDSNRQSVPGSESICDGQGGSPTKADKLDIVGFLQRLKETLHHSVNTDSSE